MHTPVAWLFNGSYMCNIKVLHSKGFALRKSLYSRNIELKEKGRGYREGLEHDA